MCRTHGVLQNTMMSIMAANINVRSDLDSKISNLIKLLKSYLCYTKVRWKDGVDRTWDEDLPWPPLVRKGILLMAMGTVPCLLWKWWT